MSIRTNFWDELLLNRDSRQDVAIRRVDDALAHTMQQQQLTTSGLYKQVRELYALDREQGRELNELRAMVKVMGDLLVQLGIDESVLRYRVEAELANQQAVEAERSKAVKTVNCTRCGKQVSLRKTNITTDGIVCDSCAY